MKKVVSVLLILAISLNLSACSGSPKPETTVSEFIEASKQFDFEKMSSKINPSSSTDKDMISELEEGFEEDSFEKYFMEYLKQNAKKITYTIVESEVNGDYATITVDFKYVDGGPLLKATLGDVFTQSISKALAGTEMNDDEMTELFISSMQAQKEIIDEAFVDKEIDIKCIKVDDKWYIDDIDMDFMNMMISNFATVFEDLNSELNDSFGNFDGFNELDDNFNEFE